MPSPCAACDNANATLFCSRCGNTYYCNVKCQRKNWKHHKKQCRKYKLNQGVVLVFNSSHGKSSWYKGDVTKFLPNKQYEITMDEWSFRMCAEIEKPVYIATEKQLRPVATKLSKTLNLEKETDILDLYLEGRDCNQEMRSLMNQIKYVMTAPHFVDYETAQFLSLNILEYLFEGAYKWRIFCFWCTELDVKMKRQSVRSRCIANGAHTLFDTMEELSEYTFCDECNDKMHYDEMIYTCKKMLHDICLKCVYKKKIVPYNKLMDDVIPILINFVDRNCAREIVEYVGGCVIQFK